MFAETSATVGNPHEPTYSHPLVRTWNKTIRNADAVVLVTPEYNHSIPAVLKNALDSLFFSFALRNKPAAVVGYSGGPHRRGARRGAPGAHPDRGGSRPATERSARPGRAGRVHRVG
jgi:multimeric flavodoxin WrbA